MQKNFSTSGGSGSGGGIANAKPKYPLDASGRYNNQHEPVSYTANKKGGIWPQGLI